MFVVSYLKLFFYAVAVIVLAECCLLAGSSFTFFLPTGQSLQTTAAQHVPGCIHIWWHFWQLYI